MFICGTSRTRIIPTTIIVTGRKLPNYLFTILLHFTDRIPLYSCSWRHCYMWHAYCITSPCFSLHSKYGYLALGNKHSRCRWRSNSCCRRPFLSCVIASLIEMSSFCRTVSLWPMWVLRRVQVMVPVCGSACLWRVGKHVNNKRLNYFVCHYE